MGFGCVSMKIPKCLSFLNLLVMPFLKVLGLLITKPQEIIEPEHHHHHHRDEDTEVLVVDGMSIISVPVKTLTCLIKNKLPVVPYSDLVRTSSQPDKVCCVCLECLDTCDMVRELVNCCHVFHQPCLDRWVDQAQVTCPLCRSMLFPPKRHNHFMTT